MTLPVVSLQRIQFAFSASLILCTFYFQLHIQQQVVANQHCLIKVCQFVKSRFLQTNFHKFVCIFWFISLVRHDVMSVLSSLET